MNFSILTKDTHEDWQRKPYNEQLIKCYREGLMHQMELSGELFDVKDDFLVVSEEKIDGQTAKKLVESTYFYDVIKESTMQSDRTLYTFEEPNGEKHTLITFR